MVERVPLVARGISLNEPITMPMLEARLDGKDIRMSEMIERVARAIALSDGYDSWETAHERTVGKYTEMARAAIQAMRDPTADMMHVGSGFVYEAWGHGPTIAKEAWQAVIDEALK